VIDQKSGLLVPEENVQALVDAIYQLYLSPRQCINMAKTGQLHIFENFTIEKNAQQFQSLYNQLIQTHATHKTWTKKISIMWSLLTSFSVAVINSYQRTSKRGLIHER